jgi:hypothetical protein
MGKLGKTFNITRYWIYANFIHNASMSILRLPEFTKHFLKHKTNSLLQLIEICLCWTVYFPWNSQCILYTSYLLYEKQLTRNTICSELLWTMCDNVCMLQHRHTRSPLSTDYFRQCQQEAFTKNSILQQHYYHYYYYLSPTKCTYSQFPLLL